MKLPFQKHTCDTVRRFISVSVHKLYNIRDRLVTRGTIRPSGSSVCFSALVRWSMDDNMSLHHILTSNEWIFPPSLAYCVMAWWVGLFGWSGSPLPLSFLIVFHILFFLLLGRGMLEVIQGDGVGGGFDQTGCLVCWAGHVITLLQVHDWPLCILVYQTEDPLNLFLCFCK